MYIHEEFPGFLLPETEQLIKACFFNPKRKQYNTEYVNERITAFFSLAAQLWSKSAKIALLIIVVLIVGNIHHFPQLNKYNTISSKHDAVL